MNSGHIEIAVKKIEIMRVHADVNAAKNILAAGLAVTACQDQPQPRGRERSPKQEPAGNREVLMLQPHPAPAA